MRKRIKQLGRVKQQYSKLKNLSPCILKHLEFLFLSSIGKFLFKIVEFTFGITNITLHFAFPKLQYFLFPLKIYLAVEKQF